MRTTLKLIIILAVIILAVSFIRENPWLNEAIELRYFGYRSIPFPLSVIILGSMLLGAIIVSASMLINQLKLKKKMREQGKKLRQLEAELHSLRNLPLMEPAINEKPAAESIPEPS